MVGEQNFIFDNFGDISRRIFISSSHAHRTVYVIKFYVCCVRNQNQHDEFESLSVIFQKGANFKVWFYFPLIIFNSQPWAFAKSLLPTYQLPIWTPSSSRQKIVSYFKWNAFGFTWRNTTFDTLNRAWIVRNVKNEPSATKSPFWPT